MNIAPRARSGRACYIIATSRTGTRGRSMMKAHP